MPTLRSFCSITFSSHFNSNDKAFCIEPRRSNPGCNVHGMDYALELFFEKIRLKVGGEGGYFGAISIQRLRAESHTLENMSYLCPGMVHLVNQGAS